MKKEKQKNVSESMIEFIKMVELLSFFWSKLVCNEDGQMKMVKCNICSSIEGRNKLVSKLNSLIKHSGLKKCMKIKLDVVLGYTILMFFLSIV
jgi:hypothetical protein